jgi:hypothetical protein
MRLNNWVIWKVRPTFRAANALAERGVVHEDVAGGRGQVAG